MAFHILGRVTDFERKKAMVAAPRPFVGRGGGGGGECNSGGCCW